MVKPKIRYGDAAHYLSAVMLEHGGYALFIRIRVCGHGLGPDMIGLEKFN